MTDQNNTAPAVWDPTARGGAGGWVRRKPADGPAAPPAPQAAPAAAPPGPPGFPPPAPVSTPQQAPGGGQPARPAATAAFPPVPGSTPAPLPQAVQSPAPLPPLAQQPGGAFPGAGVPGAPGPHAGPGAPVAPPFGQEADATQRLPLQPGTGAPPTAPPPFGASPGGPSFPAQPGAAPGFPPFEQQPGFPPQGFDQRGPAPQGPGRQPFDQQAFEQPGFGRQPSQPGFPPPAQAGYDQPGFDRPGFDRPGPEYEIGYEEERPRSRTPLLAAVGGVLVLVIGVGAFWAVRNSDDDGKKPAVAAKSAQPAPVPGTGGDAGGGTAPSSAPSTAAPSPTAPDAAGPKAAEQAKAFDGLLARGENAKAPIGSAVAKVRSCPAKAEIDGAVEVFETGAKQRDELIADLAKLELTDLPGGAEAAQTLKTAWQQSGDIDRAYAAWARTVGSQGCANNAAPNTADLKRANDLNPQATQSKKDFVAKWNSIAGVYTLTPRTWDRI
ncbi:hypothetical protein [Kitasatospora camelliae]|uniref:Uncharacterized protein n=1 Tax=Kitasatospora camelliae TaxID=3156397 RepID=A0AAU8JU79_9ACTN